MRQADIHAHADHFENLQAQLQAPWLRMSLKSENELDDPVCAMTSRSRWSNISECTKIIDLVAEALGVELGR